MKRTLDVFLVYGSNAWHTDLVRLKDSDHETDLLISISLVVGLVQSLLLNAKKPIITPPNQNDENLWGQME